MFERKDLSEGSLKQDPCTWLEQIIKKFHYLRACTSSVLPRHFKGRGRRWWTRTCWGLEVLWYWAARFISNLTIYFSAFQLFSLKLCVLQGKSLPNQRVSMPAFCWSTPSFFDLLLFHFFTAFFTCTSRKKLIAKLLMFLLNRLALREPISR